MTVKDNKFALELFVANHNMEHDSDDQLNILEASPKTFAILTTADGAIAQLIDLEESLQRQTLWFIANRKVYRHLDETYRNLNITANITNNGFNVDADNSRIFLKPIGTKDIYVAVEHYKNPKQIILESNGVKTIIKNPEKVIKRCSKTATYDNLNETIQYLQHKILVN